MTLVLVRVVMVIVCVYCVVNYLQQKYINFLINRISEYIPPHPAVPRILGGVERAINDFHASTADVVGLLLADYRYNCCNKYMYSKCYL